MDKQCGVQQRDLYSCESFPKKEASVEGGVQKKSNPYMEHDKEVQSSAKVVIVSCRRRDLSGGEHLLTDSGNH